MKTSDELVQLFKNEWKWKITTNACLDFLNNCLTTAANIQDNLLVLIFEGFTQQIKKNFSDAEDLFQKAHNIDSNSDLVLYGLSLSTHAQHKLELAQKYAQEALILDPTSALFLYRLGSVLYSMNNLYEAEHNLSNSISEDNNYATPHILLSKIYRRQEQYNEAIQQAQKAHTINPDDYEPLYEIAIAYDGLGETLKAVKYCEEAITKENTTTYPYYLISNIYTNQEETHKAIEYYEKAYNHAPDNIDPLIRIADIYNSQDDPDTALEYLTEAHEVDNNSFSLWNNFGNTYRKLKDYKKSLSSYEKSLRIKPDYTIALINIALLYNYDLNNEDIAYRNFELALQYAQQNDEVYISNRAQFHLNKIEEKKPIVAFLNAATPPKEPAKKVLRDTLKKNIIHGDNALSIEDIIHENKKSFQNFLKEPTTINITSEDQQSYFQVLRRWNSYTPIIADNFHISKGGGYFLKVNGKGIVIDPGFNFIDNFRGEHHFFYEIDAVLISHAHNDHTADLESILTLLYKYNESIKGDRDNPSEGSIRAELAEKHNKAANDISDREIDIAFNKSPRRKTIDLYMTQSTFKKYSGMFSLMKSTNYKIHIFESEDIKKICNIEIKALPAKHHDILSNQDSIGFAFNIGNASIVYTGDTGWGKTIEKSYRNLRRTRFYKNKSFTLLVAHIGGFKAHEIKYVNPKTQSESYYKYHLGRLGLAKVNELLKPDLCFISEFGEELKGHRIHLAQIYTDAFKNTSKPTIFFPADINLTAFLETGKIKAVTALAPEAKELEHRRKFDVISPDKVGFRLLRKDYSIHYFEKEAIDECELVSILHELYDDSMK